MSKREKHAVEMRARLVRWEKSGVSLRAFAEQEGVPYTTLSYWRRQELEESPERSRRGRAEASRALPASTAPDLVPVQILSREALGGYELRLPGGIEIRVPPGFESREVARLLELARTC